jgi:hypothetical protein
MPKLSISDVEKKILESIRLDRERDHSSNKERIQKIQMQSEWIKSQNRIFEKSSSISSNSSAGDGGGTVIKRGSEFNQILRRNSISESNQEYEVKLSDGSIVNIRESEIISSIKSGQDWRINVNSIIKIGKRLGSYYIYAKANQYTQDNLLNLPTY